MTTFICFAFHQKDPDGPVRVQLSPRLGAGAAGVEVLAAAAPGRPVPGIGLGPAAILPLRAVGAIVGRVNAPAAAPLPGSPVVIVVVVQAPLEAAATAALSGSPVVVVVVVVQAPLQAPAAAPVPLPAARPVVGTTPLQAVLPAAAALSAAAGPAPLAVPAARASAIKFVHQLESPVMLVDGRAALRRGQLDLPGPLDHLSQNKQWGRKTITTKHRECSG